MHNNSKFSYSIQQNFFYRRTKNSISFIPSVQCPIIIQYIPKSCMWLGREIVAIHEHTKTKLPKNYGNNFGKMPFPIMLIFWNTMKMECHTYCACQETSLFETTPHTFGNSHWDCNQHEGHVLGGPSIACTPKNGQQTSVVYYRFIWNHFDYVLLQNTCSHNIPSMP